ncbi:putative NAD(P)/FAD-binding protein YdhS [Pseudomonas nitritireducens]|uniref:Putative NAD(P)/FAD-binding protein YdhS n=1 Tax=Pseudomonas nitroreducens TaxID=46680 RepID=A0A7W7KSV8_PSENT|nr:FAD/NAD(P)-binding protein [Pseudomonas nitritireducens]MBB4867723.1 putative NAD(P)/FAD-binding protein YdhS [Pseudomonas nitritireducens]
MEHIAIIGSGFCGTALAIQLLRNAKGPLRLSLINRSGRLARGLAYGTRSASHILNVPAERMSLFPDQPSDFLEFARRQMPEAKPGDFLPRRFYGDYLQDRLGHAIAEAAPGVRFSSLCQQVLELTDQGDHLRLLLDDGQPLESRKVIIATGNFTPATPAPLKALEDDPGYLRDPWTPGALEGIPAAASVLLLGAGLTMYDMALALQDQGHRGPLLALSRRALLPQAHRDNASHPVLPELPQAFRQATGLNQRVRDLRLLIRQASADGHDWRDVIAALRPLTPQLWQALEERERSRFLRHLQPYWDVHRHRAAPPVAQRVSELRDSGQLRVQAGRVLAARPTNPGIAVTVRQRGARQSQEQQFDYLINCTGPCTNLRSVQETLLNGLLERGVIRQDRQCLGLDTDDQYRLLDVHGQANPNLYLLSPMLRASHWEATAVPELRNHAAQLAGLLLA